MMVTPAQEAEDVAVEPVVKEVRVPLSQANAFELFTARSASWWPLVSHSVGGDDSLACTFEPRVGGRFYETVRDGTEHTWGTLLAWEPPARIALTWHPGRTPSTEQHLEVTFSPIEGGTLVRLVHTGWERLGKVGPEERDSYVRGWDFVLARFIVAAGA